MGKFPAIMKILKQICGDSYLTPHLLKKKKTELDRFLKCNSESGRAVGKSKV